MYKIISLRLKYLSQMRFFASLCFAQNDNYVEFVYEQQRLS
jgi:hypothetical protein